MFKELVTLAEKLRRDGELPPVAYKPKSIDRIVELGGAQPIVSGPFKKGELRQVFAPDRQRSGKVSEGNLKPLLLLDKAQYALGVSPEGREGETALLHGEFIGLLRQAGERTGLPEIDAVLRFVTQPPSDVIREVRPGELIAFRVDPIRFPFEEPDVQRFWAEHLAGDLRANYEAACGVCGERAAPLRILPRELVLFAQKCQLTSFNLASFTSHGRIQTENSPICFDCASSVVDTLDYLIRSEVHRRVLVLHRNAQRQVDPLRSQLAVFWLSAGVEGAEIRADDVVIDLRALFSTPLLELPAEGGDPSPDLKQMEALLQVPWTSREASLDLSAEAFHLTILSANKGRLVVRDWFSVSIADLRERLRRFLAAVRLANVWGDEPRPRSIRDITDAVDSGDPNLARGLLRTAYLGHAPPLSLLGASVARLRGLWQEGKRDKPYEEAERIRHIEGLTAAIKLVLTYGRETDDMEKTAPYLCGQLFAILEKAQRDATWKKSRHDLNRTIVERFYGSASTAPCSVFGNLIRLGTTAHLSELGGDINGLMEGVMRDLDDAGGFPIRLRATQQAEFALGFYAQRAAFRANGGSQQAAQQS